MWSAGYLLYLFQLTWKRTLEFNLVTILNSFISMSKITVTINTCEPVTCQNLCACYQHAMNRNTSISFLGARSLEMNLSLFDTSIFIFIITRNQYQFIVCTVLICSDFAIATMWHKFWHKLPENQIVSFSDNGVFVFKKCFNIFLSKK